jgi:F-type H+-transporting ATPase subunit epsilon
VAILSATRDLERIADQAKKGELGVLPGHAALVSRLGIGEVRVHRDRLGGDDREFFAIRGGFLQVEKDVVTLLVTQAAAGSDVDVEAAEGELRETIEALAHPENDERYAELLGDRQWCEARLRAARRTREWADRIGRAAGSLRDDVG